MNAHDEATTFEVAVEEAKKRCRAVKDRIESLRLSLSCKRTLLRLVQSELSFLYRISLSSDDSIPDSEPSICTNIGHLEVVVHILQQPNITGVSRICKPIPFPPSKHGEHGSTSLKGAHVDIVCTLNGNPLWFIVSDRNPKYITWHGHESSRNKGLKKRIEQVLHAARCSISLKPTSLIFFFANGLDDFVIEKFKDEFKATDFEMDFPHFNCEFSEEHGGEWMDIHARSYRQASVLEIKVDCSGNLNPLSTECGTKDSLVASARLNLSVEDSDVSLCGSFGSLISQMKLFSPKDLSSEDNLVNFDTTALIAIISGISNGNTENLLATPEDVLRSRFKSNFEFVIAQVMSEIQNPIHVELSGILSGKRGIICEIVCSEFKELVLMCGGPNEKLRANELLKQLVVVSDSPSVRMMSLPTTRKLALKNKIVFGTGDYWHAPTLTANMAFVRAISQTGMSLFTLEHRPRALTGD